ncbi:hypothetical protein M406DRAFT_354880 [Cryphonectria parasitica EP155]|uniref:Uncharacterized protein n=1 Tax=Cryphonectria parasitica (strain ATCC 38755 / EP155) TaxID=660469 RepID=A0A9P4Y7I7_CRYP1|nr:uncharacterized protein M406DRAFT_354880 [Cryphonectria parasitica EP155]KAF3768352.1 hypothetical protein M406DRAFT_354880 [Cryphonectria parasitica EP155]
MRSGGMKTKTRTPLRWRLRPVLGTSSLTRVWTLKKAPLLVLPGIQCTSRNTFSRRLLGCHKAKAGACVISTLVAGHVGYMPPELSDDKLLSLLLGTCRHLVPLETRRSISSSARGVFGFVAVHEWIEGVGDIVEQ